MASDRNRKLQERAYAIWVDQGRPHGAAEDHWRQAEQEERVHAASGLGAAKAGNEQTRAETETAPRAKKAKADRPAPKGTAKATGKSDRSGRAANGSGSGKSSKSSSSVGSA